MKAMWNYANRIVGMADAPDRRAQIGYAARFIALDDFESAYVNTRMRDAFGLSHEC
jgi:hypothetical protein